MSDLSKTIDTHLSALNEPDRAKRGPLIERVWSPTGRQVDPPLSGEGHAGISDLADAVHTHYAGHRFRRVSGVDTHNSQFRYAFELAGPDGNTAISGIDVGEVDDDGRLVRITGFFGDLPALDGD
ncbi:MAG: nuclear transport factor 2 family protein [Acidimicrobiales bacterium]